MQMPRKCQLGKTILMLNRVYVLHMCSCCRTVTKRLLGTLLKLSYVKSICIQA